MSRLVDRLIGRAQRRPYYHLSRPHGLYMRRWWLFGHGTERDRTDDGRMCNPMVGRFARWLAQHIVVRVHQIVDSDKDRDLHDHPSWNISLVLSGGYWEVVPHPHGSRYPFKVYRECGLLVGRYVSVEDDRALSEPCIAYWRAPGHFVFRRATDRHIIVLPYRRTAWSVFIIGKKSNDWGFYTVNGKVDRRDYGSVHR